MGETSASMALLNLLGGVAILGLPLMQPVAGLLGRLVPELRE